MPDPTPTPPPIPALDRFKVISEILAVPAPGAPLPDGRKWIVPCPDSKALADFSGGNLDAWRRFWTACPPAPRGDARAENGPETGTDGDAPEQ